MFKSYLASIKSEFKRFNKLVSIFANPIDETLQNISKATNCYRPYRYNLKKMYLF